MPLPNGVPAVSPVRSILPTSQYPHLKRIVHELDYMCASCSSASGGGEVWKTFMESERSPISGPGISSKKGMVATTFLLLCPECRTVPTGGPFIESGIINLLNVPADYKRPPRPSSTVEDSLVTDTDDEDGLVVMPKKAPFGAGKHKKKDSDLKKTRKKRSDKGPSEPAA
jgi:hypothetical protein